jgi:S-adenosylmethionine hydrolase
MGLADKSRASKNAVLLYLTALTNPMNSNEVVTSVLNIASVKSKKGQYFVLPDNGVITPVIERDGLQSAREITNRSWMISDAISSTFHGRDIFSPATAHLAAGWDFNQAGPEVNELVRLKPENFCNE